MELVQKSGRLLKYEKIKQSKEKNSAAKLHNQRPKDPTDPKRQIPVAYIIKNLISGRQITIDNSCSFEFDVFSLSVKDLTTRKYSYDVIAWGPSTPSM